MENILSSKARRLVNSDEAGRFAERGWCEFDPTNNLIPFDKHIVTAYGRDYNDIVPIKGIIYSSGDHTVDVLSI